MTKPSVSANKKAKLAAPSAANHGNSYQYVYNNQSTTNTQSYQYQDPLNNDHRNTRHQYVYNGDNFSMSLNVIM